MRVSNIQTTKTNTHTTFFADFQFASPIGGRKRRAKFVAQKALAAFLHPLRAVKFGFSSTHRIWYTLPNEFVSEERIADAFFILAMPMAIASNEDLVFTDSISTELAEKIEEIRTYYIELAKRRIAIHVTSVERRDSTRNQVAQFFTLGGDSFHTLCCHTEAGDPLPRHLIYVEGYDAPVYEKAFFKTIRKNIDDVAEQMHCRSVFVSTNLRELSDLILGWGWFHFSALAAVETLLGFAKLYVSGESFNTPHWGLRFGAEKLYSTTKRKMILVGHLESRLQKTRRVVESAHSKLFLKYVRVCWENVAHGEMEYNCSRCQKCLKTELGLLVLGIKNPPTFKPLDLAAMKEIHLVEHVYQDWVEVYVALQKQKQTDPQLLAILEHVLAKPIRT